jgi:hypothetical protein
MQNNRDGQNKKKLFRIEKPLYEKHQPEKLEIKAIR